MSRLSKDRSYRDQLESWSRKRITKPPSRQSGAFYWIGDPPPFPEEYDERGYKIDATYAKRKWREWRKKYCLEELRCFYVELGVEQNVTVKEAPLAELEVLNSLSNYYLLWLPLFESFLRKREGYMQYRRYEWTKADRTNMREIGNQALLLRLLELLKHVYLAIPELLLDYQPKAHANIANSLLDCCMSVDHKFTDHLFKSNLENWKRSDFDDFHKRWRLEPLQDLNVFDPKANRN